MAYNEPQQGHDHGEHGHSKYLHHHFESLQQQFDSDKLGMWLFLVTEILMFGGLFCAYSVYRANHPEIFMYADQFLDKRLGGLNTAILIMSSFTMAWAVRAAQLNQRKLLVTLLALTICGGAGFMCIKGVEYHEKWEHGLLWGKYYVSPSEHEKHEGEAAGAATETGAAKPAEESTAEAGATESAGTQDTEAPAESTETENTGAQAPAQSEAPDTVEAPPAGAAAESAGTPAGAAGASTTGEQLLVTAAAPAQQGGLQIEPSKIALAAEGPPGLAPATVPQSAHGPGPHGVEPRNVRTFFAIYFAMTGLHALHVLAGMVVITIMLVLSVKGRFNSEYYTPIDLTGLFWHLVDVIWIFLFPLLYLIH